MAFVLGPMGLASKVQALALRATLTIFWHHIVVVVSGMQLLRLRSAIRRHHPPQRAVLSQICCFTLELK